MVYRAPEKFRRSNTVFRTGIINMQNIAETLHHEFAIMPLLALFIALVIGFAIGKIPFGNFRLGGVAGSLIAGILVSLFGVQIDASIRSLLFALSMFAIGYESGPQFFNSLGKKMLREALMSLTMVFSAFLTVVAVAKIFNLDKGLAIGVASGGLTQSSMIGVVSDALSNMAIEPDKLNKYIDDIGVGYTITYIFGTLGPIVVCTVFLPKFMGKGIKEAACESVSYLSDEKTFDVGENFALNELIGRAYRVEKNNFSDVAEIEAFGGELPITVEKIKRGATFLHISPQVSLELGDILLLVGRREAVIPLGELIGSELSGLSGVNLVMKTREVILNNAEFGKLTLKELREKINSRIRHGIYILSVSRSGKSLKNEEPVIIGDILKIYGSEEDVKKAASAIGVPIIPSVKTDVLLMCAGILAGLLVGSLVVKAGGVPLTLGSGGGILLSGLLTGYLKAKRPQFGGAIPSAAAELLKDFSFAGFVATIGLNSGAAAVQAVHQEGASLFVGGLLITLAPLLVCILFGRYVLKYKNSAVFAGALSGACCSSSAFIQIINLSENAVPSVSFAVTYGISSVLFTLLGPILAVIV